MEKIILFIVTALVIILVFFGVKEEARFQGWAKEHCTIVGVTSGTVSFGSGLSDGKMVSGTIFSPGKTSYKCDDGVIYTR